MRSAGTDAAVVEQAYFISGSQVAERRLRGGRRCALGRAPSPRRPGQLEDAPGRARAGSVNNFMTDKATNRDVSQKCGTRPVDGAEEEMRAHTGGARAGHDRAERRQDLRLPARREGQLRRGPGRRRAGHAGDTAQRAGVPAEPGVPRPRRAAPRGGGHPPVPRHRLRAAHPGATCTRSRSASTRPPGSSTWTTTPSSSLTPRRCWKRDRPACWSSRATSATPGRSSRDARGLIDFSEPVAVLLFAVLHFLPDDEDPHGIVCSLTEALAPGSAVAVSHITGEGIEPDKSLAAQKVYQGASAPAVPRSRAGHHPVLRRARPDRPGRDGHQPVADAVDWSRPHR